MNYLVRFLALIALSCFLHIGALHAQDIKSTQSDEIIYDQNNNNQANPGDSIKYTVIIKNDGALPLQNATFNFFGLDLCYLYNFASIRMSNIARDDEFTLFDIDAGVTGNLFQANGLLPDILGIPPSTLTSFGGGSLGGAVTNNAPGATVPLADGTLQIDADGTITLTGTPYTVGTYTVMYRLTNALGTSDATVTIIVEASNICPEPMTDRFMVFESEGPGDIDFNLLDNDMDADGDPLMITKVNGNAAGLGNFISEGFGVKLKVTSDGNIDVDANSKYEFLDLGEKESELITYTVSDGQCEVQANVIIIIEGEDDAPVAVDDEVSTDEDTNLNGNVLAANPSTEDFDLDISPLTVSEVNGLPANVGMEIALGNGLLTVNSNGTFTFEPNGGYESLMAGMHATVSFTYKIKDNNNTESNAAKVTITINGVNDPPVAVNDALTTDENTLLNADLLVANPTTPDSDPDGPALTVIEVNGTAGDVGTPITLGAGLLTVNANGSVVFDPNGGYENLSAVERGAEFFSYTISDGALESTAIVTIRIIGVNDAPVAIDDAVTTDEDTNLNGDVLIANPTTADSDVDDTSLTVSEVNGMAANVGMEIAVGAGLLTLNSDGTFLFKPNGGYDDLTIGTTATATFKYKIHDNDGAMSNEATATITITPVNDPPVAMDDMYDASQTAVFTATTSILANDTDPDAGDTKTLTTVNGNAANIGTEITLASGAMLTVNMDGTFSYNPNCIAAGTETFMYTMEDAAGVPSTATVTIQVEASIWFVKNDHTPNAIATDNGSFGDPFTTLAQAQTASSAGDTIFVYEGDGTSTGYNGIILQSEQVLQGEGVALTCPIDGSEIVPAGIRPIIASPGNEGVAVVDNNTIKGLNIGATSTGIESQAAIGTLNISDVEITQSGRALALSNGTVNAVFDNISSSASAVQGIDLSSLAGSIVVNGSTTIDGSGMEAIRITSSSGSFDFGNTQIGQTTPVAIGVSIGGPGATVTFDDLDITSNSGFGFKSTGGTVNISGTPTIQSTGGPALDISNTATSVVGGWNFDSVSSINSTTEGIKLNSLSHDFTVTGNTTITGSSNEGIEVDNVPNVTFGASGGIGILTVMPKNAGTTAAIDINNVSGAFAINSTKGEISFSGNNDRPGIFVRNTTNVSIKGMANAFTTQPADPCGSGSDCLSIRGISMGTGAADAHAIDIDGANTIVIEGIDIHDIALPNSNDKPFSLTNIGTSVKIANNSIRNIDEGEAIDIRAPNAADDLTVVITGNRITGIGSSFTGAPDVGILLVFGEATSTTGSQLKANIADNFMSGITRGIGVSIEGDTGTGGSGANEITIKDNRIEHLNNDGIDINVANSSVSEWLIKGNVIDGDTGLFGGPDPDRGIDFVPGLFSGTAHVTISENTVRDFKDEGIRIRSAVDPLAGTIYAEIKDNVVQSTTSGNEALSIEARDGHTIHAIVTGNELDHTLSEDAIDVTVTNASTGLGGTVILDARMNAAIFGGTPPVGPIDLNENNSVASGSLSISQMNTTDLSSENNGATVSQSGTITPSVAPTAPTLPDAPPTL